MLGLISILYLTLFPLYWEYGEMNYTGEGRTYNVTFIVLCAIVLVASGVVVRALVHETAILALSGVLAILLIASPSTRQVFETLRVAPLYLEEEQVRARELRRANPDDVVFVDRISVRPAGLFWGDVEPDESHWINVCVARYYKLHSVRSRM